MFLFLLGIATASAGNMCEMDLPRTITSRRSTATSFVGFRNDELPTAWSTPLLRRITQSIEKAPKGHLTVTQDVVYQHGQTSEFRVERLIVTVDIRRRRVVSGTREFGTLPYDGQLTDITTNEFIDPVRTEHASCSQNSTERERLMTWALSALIMLD